MSSLPGSSLLDTQMVILKEFSKKVDFGKNQQTTKKALKISEGAKSYCVSYIYLP